MGLEHASGVAKLYSGGDLAVEPWANRAGLASRSDAKCHVVEERARNRSERPECLEADIW